MTSKSLQSMSIEEVDSWLAQVDLKDFSPYFKKYSIYGNKLKNLTEQEICSWNSDQSEKKIKKLMNQVNKNKKVPKGNFFTSRFGNNTKKQVPKRDYVPAEDDDFVDDFSSDADSDYDQPPSEVGPAPPVRPPKPSHLSDGSDVGMQRRQPPKLPHQDSYEMNYVEPDQPGPGPTVNRYNDDQETYEIPDQYPDDNPDYLEPEPLEGIPPRPPKEPEDQTYEILDDQNHRNEEEELYEIPAENEPEDEESYEIPQGNVPPHPGRVAHQYPGPPPANRQPPRPPVAETKPPPTPVTTAPPPRYPFKSQAQEVPVVPDRTGRIPFKPGLPAYSPQTSPKVARPTPKVPSPSTTTVPKVPNPIQPKAPNFRVLPDATGPSKVTPPSQKKLSNTQPSTPPSQRKLLDKPTTVPSRTADNKTVPGKLANLPFRPADNKAAPGKLANLPFRPVDNKAGLTKPTPVPSRPANNQAAPRKPTTVASRPADDDVTPSGKVANLKAMFQSQPLPAPTTRPPSAVAKPSWQQQQPPSPESGGGDKPAPPGSPRAPPHKAKGAFREERPTSAAAALPGRSSQLPPPLPSDTSRPALASSGSAHPQTAKPPRVPSPNPPPPPEAATLTPPLPSGRPPLLPSPSNLLVPPPPSTASIPKRNSNKEQTRELPPIPTANTAANRNSQNFINQYPWYHEGITRQQSEKALMDFKKDGSFIMRDSKAGPESSTPYSLAVYHHGRIKHLQIRRRPDSKYALGTEKSTEKAFDSPAELIQYHQSAPFILARDEGKVTLTRDCPVFD